MQSNLRNTCQKESVTTRKVLRQTPKLPTKRCQKAANDFETPPEENTGIRHVFPLKTTQDDAKTRLEILKLR